MILKLSESYHKGILVGVAIAWFVGKLMLSRQADHFRAYRRLSAKPHLSTRNSPNNFIIVKHLKR